MATRCTTCGQSNQDGVRFCGECGAQLIFDGNENQYADAQNQTNGYQNANYGNPQPGSYQQNYNQQAPGYNPSQQYQQGQYQQGPYPGQPNYNGQYQGGAYPGGAYPGGPYPGGPYQQGTTNINVNVGGMGGYGYENWPVKSRIVAALLALFIGGLGIHKFYLGRPVQGIFYILFAWTFIPSAIAFFEGIIYLLTSDQAFSRKYMVRVEGMR